MHAMKNAKVTPPMETKMLDNYNDHGQTALHISEVNMHLEMAGLLITAGAKSLPMIPCVVDDCNNECRVPHNCKEVHNETQS